MIAFLYSVFSVPHLKARTALILCPKNVLYNWIDEINQWVPSEEQARCNFTPFLLSQGSM